MIKLKISLSAMLLALATTLSAQVGPDEVIPRPVRYSVTNGMVPSSMVEDAVVISDDAEFVREIFPLDDFARREAYGIEITPGGITIKAVSDEGIYRARTTLEYMKGMGESLKCCTIFDYPRFRHRGVMFDISRNFRDKDFILKQIDVLASLKMNSLHLHLADDAGWRVEIGSYPELCSRAAYRFGKTWEEWSAGGCHYANRSDAGASGGFLTKEDVRQIVKYAASRHINVIPEIELPGHSAEVLDAYPSLACVDEVGGEPVFSSDVCIGNEATFAFYDAVLGEIIDMFPSEYIHIGGDEASKGSWEKCPRCKERMLKEGLSGVDELQSYMIRRIGKFLSSKGRILLGWDEIMQGGLAAGAAVMSWRGTQNGEEAIRASHDVIMSPNTYCYLDYYQDAPMYCPRAIGGYIPLDKVYSYDPAEGISDISHLLGIQGNLWCEFISSAEQFEYMLYPRAFAIAEIGWSPQEVRSYPDFRRRALSLSKRISKRGYNTFNLEEEFGERPQSKEVVSHMARGCAVKYNIPYSKKYPSTGTDALTDGKQGGWSYSNNAWQGFSSDMDVVVDLGEKKPIHYVGAWFFSCITNWVAFPEKMEISVSDDGSDFRSVYTLRREIDDDNLKGSNYALYGVPISENARYVRVRAVRADKPRHEFLFTDEIVVN